MKTYEESMQYVYSQVAPEVNKLYEYFRKKQGLAKEENTEAQLEILAVQKRCISKTFILDLSLLADYYAREMTDRYRECLRSYKKEINKIIKS